MCKDKVIFEGSHNHSLFALSKLCTVVSIHILKTHELDGWEVMKKVHEVEVGLEGRYFFSEQDQLSKNQTLVLSRDLEMSVEFQ